MGDDVFGLVGRTVDGKVRVDDCIGEGGFAVVYRGFHLAFEQPVALKCLKVPSHFDSEAQASFLTRFREEGKMLFRLSQHAAVVRVFDIGEVETSRGEQVPYLVLEWLDGEELSDLLSRRNAQGLAPPSEKEALTLLRPAVDAIALAHRLGIAHRDLKPSNLILANTVQGSVLKVLDFGIAKVMQEGETSALRATKTSSGFHAFSPQYGAPEQFLSSRFGATGPWTDVHALGLILTEIVVGKPAMVGEEHGDFHELAVRALRPTPRTLGAQVSDPFEALCRRCLASDPADRFPDADALLAAMDAIELGVRDWTVSTPVTPEHASETFPSPLEISDAALTIESTNHLPFAETEASDAKTTPEGRRSRRLILGAGLAILFAVAGLVGWLVPSRSQNQAPTEEPCIAVAGGTFRMGAEGAAPDQRPAHDVTVSDFALDKTQVTVQAYRLCVEAGACVAVDTSHLVSNAEEQAKWNTFCNWGKPGRDQHPMNCVDWHQAQAYCAWVHKRLPSEQEWEYATKGGEEQRMHAWGDDKPDADRLNACDLDCGQQAASVGWKWKPIYERSDGWPGTSPVGSFPNGQGRWGHLDLAGNVWEWTSSPFCPYGDRRNEACSKTNMVARGGGWASRYPGIFRGSFRSKYPREYRAADVGFRCAR
ncbi:MAG TPA: bifunctional serine/threonine-protein kinase/formylglycine-generating enzyme family protein [Polyangiaceae bacterium]|jgi:formylglycine-generating enzyme required for sulfatase activity|nr:MAG: Serine/threonine-protein kinase PknL [Deltaproteobacteria bacterium ADurb.Bin207]HNS96802.1 bifunctional serine/threonine-protein kinase/formylglycine-generating enzyme family protein [Polyangiaceae bacterium]HNZ23304.1 bifunctional serine/threonine-protein kinase/formylglycine-generating enzyme family protein [Polyangiaceae bacterium]HOD21926.1 bifunctional serine/threonine-protein kinase/formylglycine-generating enzyme family protein [Polyangiaceae bacterium]HOE49371.1 bifunctional se